MRRVVFLAALIFGTSVLHAQDFVVPPDESVQGLPQAEWSEMWWQWAASFDQRSSPVADRTGDLCAARQGGTVWFLAGTYGTQRTIRTCRMPRGRHVFFPLINYVVVPTPELNLSCSAALQRADALTEAAEFLVVELDGQRVGTLNRYRQATECFDIAAGSTPSRVYPSAANGYYVMLRPLAVGTHTLHFGGVLPGMSQAVTYTLIVE